MKPLGYVEEVAMTKLTVTELEQEFAAVIANKNRNPAQIKHACSIAAELGKQRAYLAELMAS